MKREWLIQRRGTGKQSVIAQNAGITQAYYSALEAGKKTPSVSIAKNIAEILEFDWTLFYENKEKGA